MIRWILDKVARIGMIPLGAGGTPVPTEARYLSLSQSLKEWPDPDDCCTPDCADCEADRRRLRR